MQKILILVLIIISNCTKNTFNNLKLKNKDSGNKIAIVIGETGKCSEIKMKIYNSMKLSLGAKECLFTNINNQKKLVGIMKAYKTPTGLMDIYISDYSTYMVGEFFQENGKLKFKDLWKTNYEHFSFIEDDYDMNWSKVIEITSYPHPSNKFKSINSYTIQTHIVNYNKINKIIGLYDVVGNGVINNTQIIKKVLESEGFEVIFSINSSFEELLKKLKYFKEINIEEKLLYYSGHGFNSSCEEYINLTNGRSLKVPNPDEIECDKIIYLLDKCSSPGERQTEGVCNILKSNNLKLVCRNLIEDSTFSKKVLYLKAAETCKVSFGSPTGYAIFTRCLLANNQHYLKIILDLNSKEYAKNALLDMDKEYRRMQLNEGISLDEITSLELLHTLPLLNSFISYADQENFSPNYTFNRNYQYVD